MGKEHILFMRIKAWNFPETLYRAYIVVTLQLHWLHQGFLNKCMQWMISDVLFNWIIIVSAIFQHGWAQNNWHNFINVIITIVLIYLTPSQRILCHLLNNMKLLSEHTYWNLSTTSIKNLSTREQCSYLPLDENV